jgi:hypothetical protein
MVFGEVGEPPPSHIVCFSPLYNGFCPFVSEFKNKIK